MSIIQILLKQIIIMFILVGVGYLMFRYKKISNEGAKTLANILIYLSLPATIIKGFLVERTPEMIRGLGISALLAVILLAVSVVVSTFFFKKDAIAKFSTAFPNPGFFGIPLIIASISDGAVFYIAAFIACLNMLQWTIGVGFLTGKSSAVSPKRIFTAPFMVAIIIGLFFFFTAIPLPSIVTEPIKLVANLNTPIAMFTIGIYLAQTDMLKMLTKPVLYKLSLVRLVIIPLISMLILWLVPARFQDLRIALLIASACPVGSNVAVYAQLHNHDYPYAVETVVISTVLSLVTIPVIVALSQVLWGL